jgi:ABC-type branched-subunit amino acid transport system substrate-binding protein
MGGNFGTVIKQLRQSGYKGTIYIGQNLTATEVESIGAEEVNGVIMCSPYVTYTAVEECTNDFLRPILNEFYAKYGYCPVSDMLYKTWDAMLLVENAVLASGSIDPVEMQKAISTLKFEGCAGTMDFTTGSNECYFGARAWVYTGQGAAGAPVVLEDWLASDLANKISLTNAG